MRLSCKNSTLLFLLIASTWSNRISAEQIDTSTASSEDVSLEHSLASSVGSSENIHANLGPYEQAIELLESLPKDREVFKKPKFTSHGLFQSQFQRLSTFLYNQLFSSEKSKDSQVKAKHPKIQQATALLEREAKLGNSDAIFTLAELNFFSYYGYPRNLKLAFDYYSQLASEKGNATAQRMVSLMYATGIGHVVERDQGKALLYSTFASLGQDTAAQMMVGYRHLKGIGTSSSCDEAVWYYKKVADKAMEQYKSGPPGGRVLPLPKVLLPEENGGIYGYAHNGGSGHRDQSEVEDILQYTRQLAEGGSIEAQLTLGYIYYRGSRFVRRNHKDAYRYFLSVASHMYNNNRVKDIKDPEEISFIGQACGMLGEMYRRGEGVPPDYDIALKWYSRGVEKENPISLNGLGVMYLEGIVVTKNIQRAQEYFELASKLKNPEAQVNLGLLYLNAPDPDYNSAIILFTEAYQAKYFPASYYLAEMYNRGLGVTKSCFAAVTLYKIISERGDWLHSPFPKAHNAYKKGDIETAFLWYLMGAEMGYEVGQTNVAWLLDEDRYELIEQSPNLIPDDLPLIYWTRSANQGQSDSRVKMGDYYYYGIGAEVNLEKAASCYEVAANDESNALGMWNMGWMHENGIGVSKDFHLAKRLYDSSLSENPDAYLPVTLSLIKLSAKYAWGYLMGDDVGDEPYFKPTPHFEGEAHHPPHHPPEESYDELSSENEFNRIAKDKDFIQWGRKKLGDDDDYEEQQDYADDEDGGFIEDLVILALCLLVGWMVYVRQFRAAGPNPQPQLDPRWRWGPLA